MTPGDPTRRRIAADAWPALALFGLSLALYLSTLSPSVVADDGGEFQMLASVLGVSHPTGYPLFLLLAALFARLPLAGDVAFRVTLFGALTAAASVALLYLTARELRAGRVAAAAAALLLAAAPRLWMHATAAEIHPLAGFFILLGIWLLLRWGEGKTPLWAVALALGFGLTHHISFRLFGPAMLAYLLLVDARLLLRPRRWLPALACLLLPLALYAYVPLRASYFAAQPQWAGEILGLPKIVAAGLVSPHYVGGGFWNLALALDYSGQFFGGHGAGIGTIAAQFFAMLRQQFPLAAFPLMALGIGVLARRQAQANWLLLIAAATVIASGVRFLASVGEGSDHFNPVYLLLALWFAVGAEAALRWLAGRLARWPWARGALALALAVIPLSSVISHYPAMAALRQADWGRAFLAQPLPEGAALVGDWNVITPLRYHQRVDGIRPDLWIIHSDAGGAAMLMSRALAEGRPFYALRQTAAGLRLLPLPARDPAAITHPADIGLGTAVRWRGYDLAPAEARPGGVLSLTLYWQADTMVGQDWTTFIHLLNEAGEKVAQVDRVPGDGIYPPSAWQPGLLVADQYELSLPSDLAPGRYRLIFGWYRPEGRLPWADGADARTLAEIGLAAP